MKKFTHSSVHLIIGMLVLMMFSGNSFALNKYLTSPNALQTNDIFVSKTNIVLNATACSDTFSISSSVNWVVTSNQTWLTVTPISGLNNGVVNVVATANTGAVQREATVTISGTNASSTVVSKIVHIVQLSLTPSTLYLNVSRTNILLPSSNACTDTFAIASNANWTIMVTGTANSTTIPTWLTVTPVAGSNNLIVNLAASANTTTAIRTALVKVTSGTIIKTIEVKQPAASATVSYLNLSRTNILLPSSNACTDTFAITSNANWTIMVTGTANSTTIPTWLTVTPIAGSNNLIVNMVATANTTTAIRTALVKVTSGTIIKTIEVKQPAASATLSYLNLSRTNILLPSSNACSDTFAISSNANWTIMVTGAANSTTIPTWLTVTPVAGSNNLIVNMAASANTTTAIRTALVKVTSGTIIKTIEVKQPAASITPASYLYVSRTNILLPSSNACSDTFAISSNANWTIMVTGAANSTTIPTWLTVTPIAGSNNLIVNMAATANTTTAIRTALIKVTSGTIIKTIEVKQPTSAITPVSYLYVSRTNILLPSSNACADTFAIASNASWTIMVTGAASSTSIPTWLTVTPIAGSNNLIVNMAATANTTTAIRTALVKVTSGTIVKTIEVKQAAGLNTLPFLNVSATILTFDATPLVSKTFNITSNSGWIITSDVNWLTYTPSNGNNNATATVTASANTSAQMRLGWLIISVPGSLSKFIQIKQAGLSTNPIISASSLFSSKSASNNMTVYPNPAINNITLTSLSDFSNNDFVEVYSLEGLIIYKQMLTGNNVNIDFQSIKKGIYFVKIYQNNEVIVKTISKN